MPALPDEIAFIALAALAACTAVQLGFYLLVFRRLATARAPLPAGEATEAVSVVLCARNEADNLAAHLPAVLDQDYPDFEVVVVNDNSTDGTKGVLEELAAKNGRLKVVHLSDGAPPSGKKKPLSAGIARAANDALVLTDADCRPASRQWLRQMAGGLAGKEIALGYGGHRRGKGLLNRIIRFETFFTAMQYLSFALSGMPYMGVGRNLAWRKPLFAAAGGFEKHRHLPSGDDDLFINAVATARNTSVVLEPASFTRSVPAESTAQWIRQKRRHIATGLHYRPLHTMLLGIFLSSQTLFYLAFAAALAGPDMGMAAGLFLAREAAMLTVFNLCLQRLGERDLFLFSPIYDVLLTLIYPLAFLLNILFKNVAWKKN